MPKFYVSVWPHKPWAACSSIHKEITYLNLEFGRDKSFCGSENSYESWVIDEVSPSSKNELFVLSVTLIPPPLKLNVVYTVARFWDHLNSHYTISYWDLLAVLHSDRQSLYVNITYSSCFVSCFVHCKIRWCTYLRILNSCHFNLSNCSWPLIQDKIKSLY